MKIFPIRFTVRRLMICILALAVLLASGRHVVEKWGPGEVISVCLVFLAMTQVLALLLSARWQVFWVGFGIAGWAYCLLSFGTPLADHLPTTWWLDGIHHGLYPRKFSLINIPLDLHLSHEGWHRVDLFRRAGHAIFSLIFGTLGGMLALILFPSRVKTDQGVDPPDGSLLKRDWRDSTSV